MFGNRHAMRERGRVWQLFEKGGRRAKGVVSSSASVWW